MGLRRRPGQVGQDNGEEQRREEMRPLRVQLPLCMRGLSVSVLLVAELTLRSRAGFLPKAEGRRRVEED